MPKKHEKRAIYGNPWVYLEASYQADRTYTSIVRAFGKRHSETPTPYLPQLAGMFPIALMSAVRRVDGFHEGPVEIDLEEIADRHFGRHGARPLELAVEVIEFWKGRDPLMGSGFKMDLNPETGIATIDWPAFAARYDKEVRFAQRQSERAKKPRKKAPQPSEDRPGSTNDPEKVAQADQNEDRPTRDEIEEIVTELSTAQEAQENSHGLATAQPRPSHSLSNELTSDFKGVKKPHKKPKRDPTSQEIERGRKIPEGKKSYPEDPDGPVVDKSQIVRFMNLEEYQAVATAQPGLIPEGLVGVKEVSV